MGRTCVVSGCSNNTRQPGKQLFPFPADPPDLVHSWVLAVNRTDDCFEQTVAKGSREMNRRLSVCNEHFRQEDLEIDRKKTFSKYGTVVVDDESPKVFRLKPNTVPTIFKAKEMDLVNRMNFDPYFKYKKVKRKRMSRLSEEGDEQEQLAENAKRGRSRRKRLTEVVDAHDSDDFDGPLISADSVEVTVEVTGEDELDPLHVLGQEVLLNGDTSDVSRTSGQNRTRRDDRKAVSNGLSKKNSVDDESSRSQCCRCRCSSSSRTLDASTQTEPDLRSTVTQTDFSGGGVNSETCT